MGVSSWPGAAPSRSGPAGCLLFLGLESWDLDLGQRVLLKLPLCSKGREGSRGLDHTPWQASLRSSAFPGRHGRPPEDPPAPSSQETEAPATKLLSRVRQRGETPPGMGCAGARLLQTLSSPHAHAPASPSPAPTTGRRSCLVSAGANGRNTLLLECLRARGPV